jgi:hypothetical protein
MALVGAENDDVAANANQGSAYVFRMNGSSWTEQARLAASDGGPRDGAGIGIALGPDVALVGAPARGGLLDHRGAVFAFHLRAADGDFDGDGRIDPTVWRLGTGFGGYCSRTANTRPYRAHSWGVSSDVPAPGDYDGDGRTDPAVWRPETGVWYALRSSSNYTTFLAQPWGAGLAPYNDVPVP